MVAQLSKFVKKCFEISFQTDICNQFFSYKALFIRKSKNLTFFLISLTWRYTAQIGPVKSPAKMVVFSQIMIALLGLVIIIHCLFKNGLSDQILISEEMNKTLLKTQRKRVNKIKH